MRHLLAVRIAVSAGQAQSIIRHRNYETWYLAKHLDVKVTVTPEQIRDLAKETDIHNLTSKLDEIHEPSVEPEHHES